MKFAAVNFQLTQVITSFERSDEMVNNPKDKKIVWCMLLSMMLVFCILHPADFVKADETVTNEEVSDKGCDIVFVLDISGSMKQTDTNKISIEIIKMLIDVCSSGNNRVGFVAYNDTIAYSYDLTEINSEKNSKKIKDYIGKVEFKGETDIGLGLNKAVNLMVDKFDKKKQPIICLLSDGETDLGNSNTGRTETDSEKDVKKSISLAKEHNIPIYTIGLNNQFNEVVDYLEVIANQTQGKSYVASSPFQLLEIINGILAKYQSSALINEKTVLSNGKIQKNEISIPHQYMEKYRIVILSSSKIETAGIVEKKKNKATVKASKYYSVIEIEQPDEEEVTVYYKTKRGASISVNVQAICNFNANFEFSKSIDLHQKQSIQFSFVDKDTNIEITDKQIYKDLECEFYIINEETKEENCISYEENADGLAAVFVPDKTGTYTIRMQYHNNFGKGSYQSKSFQVTDVPPKDIGKIEVKMCKGSNKQYNLEKLFESKIDTDFHYSIEDVTNHTVKTSIADNRLILKAQEIGDKSITVIAQKNENKYRITLHVEVKTFWELYQEYIVGIAIVSVIAVTIIIYLIVYIINKRKRKKGLEREFSGELVGYFIDVKSANDTHTMKWDLSKYPGIGITLNTLVNDAGISDYFMGADRIWIYPNGKTEIEIVHSLEGSIFVGNRLISKDVPTPVYHGDVIYVCFEENGAEIELHYRSAGGI